MARSKSIIAYLTSIIYITHWFIVRERCSPSCEHICGADSGRKAIVMEVIAKSGEVLLFDEPYYSIAIKYNWRSTIINGKKYFSAFVDGKSQSLSKLVFDIKPNHIVYHKNGISEDFSNSNIIICSRHDVWQITEKKPGKMSQYYYVTWYNSHSKWGVEQERNRGIRQRWMFHEEIEAALWADYRNAILLQNGLKRNFPELTHEQLEERITELNIKYGRDNKERLSKTRQGNSFCRNKTTPYIGVSKQGNKYVAQICHNKKQMILCRVDEPLEAARAYDKKALELFGKYARINGV